MITPQEAAQKLHDNPAEAGAALIAIGLLLKVAFLVKIISYALLSFGVIFLWEAFKPKIKHGE